MSRVAGNLSQVEPHPKTCGVEPGAGRSISGSVGEFWTRPGHPKRESLTAMADDLPRTCLHHSKREITPEMKNKYSIRKSRHGRLPEDF